MVREARREPGIDDGIEDPSSGGSSPDDPCEDEDKCVVEMQSQVLRESLPVAGAGLDMHYSSARAAGYVAARELTIPLSTSELSADVNAISLDISVAGRSFQQRYEDDPVNLRDQSAVFTWDGLDAYDRPMLGAHAVRVAVGYEYDGVYQKTERFGYSGNGTAITGDRNALTVTLWKHWQSTLGAWQPNQVGLGGWSLAPHHGYDPRGHVLYRGDATRRRAERMPPVIGAFAGNGASGSSGDGGPAVEARLSYVWDLVTGPDGSVYLADTGNHRIRRVNRDGTIDTILSFGYPRALAFCPDQLLYFATYTSAGGYKIWRIEGNGSVSHIAGNGQLCAPSSYDCGDFGPSLDAKLGQVMDIVCAASGDLFLAESNVHRVRRIGPDGVIVRVAGTNGGFAGDGGPAIEAKLSIPEHLALDPDGGLLVADDGNDRVRRIDPDGTINTVVGGGSCLYPPCGDGGPAADATVWNLHGLAVAADGTIFLGDGATVRMVDSAGFISTFAGTDPYDYGCDGICGNEGPAAAAQLDQPTDLTMGPRGELFVSEMYKHRVRVVASPLPGTSIGDIVIADEAGDQLYVFDRNGRHFRTVDATTGADRYTFTYTTEGLLASVTDRDGNQTTIERDAQGAPTKLVAPYGQETLLNLDTEGMLAGVTLPTGAEASMTYANGLMTTFDDLRGFEHGYTYDPVGRLETVRDASGAQSTLERTAIEHGHEVTSTSAEGRVARYAMQETALGTVLTNTFPNGTQASQSIGLDGAGTTMLPDGRTVTTQMSPDPRFGMQAPLTTTTVVTPSGLTRTVEAQKTAELYDALDPLSLVTETQTTTINGRTFTSVFDAATRTTTKTTPVGRISTTTIDEQGRVVHTAPPGVLSTETQYDAYGRVSTFAQGTRQQTFGYDPQTGYLSSVTDALTQQTLYERDAMGRTTRQTLADGSFIDFGYDGKGNLISLTPPEKLEHGMQYTPADLMASYDPPAVSGSGATSTTYGYNDDRQLQSLLRPDGQSVARSYDPVTGQLTTLTLPTGTATYAYDPATGQLTGISGPYDVDMAYGYDGHLRTDVTWSGAISGAVHTGYDDDFRPATETVNGGAAVSFDYDDDGLLTSAGALTRTLDPTTAQLSASALGDVSESYGYNDYGELESYDASYLGTSMLSVTYTRDALGRIETKTETSGGETHTYVYRYDLRGRLYKVEKDGAEVESYGYDANGNRLGGTYDDQDRLLSYGGTTYTYTANGELASTSDGTQYSYDAQGALLSVDLPDGRLIEYVIDGQGRRVGKKVDGGLQWGLLYRSHLQPVARLDGSGAVVDRYVYGSSRNVPDYVERGGSLYRVVTDHLGSVRLVVDVSTGEVVQRMAYDSFGRVLVDEVASGWVPVPFGFAGGVYDRDTGLVRFGARDYDPLIGRWTAKDPLLVRSSETNIYAYAANDPVNMIDPTGTDTLSDVFDWVRIAGAAAAAGAEAAGAAAAGATILLCGAVFASDAPVSCRLVGAGFCNKRKGRLQQRCSYGCPDGYTFSIYIPCSRRGLQAKCPPYATRQ